MCLLLKMPYSFCTAICSKAVPGTGQYDYTHFTGGEIEEGHGVKLKQS